MEEFSPVTHVIFDMDGLLLDTERLYTEAHQNVVSEYDKEYKWDLKVKCMGMKGKDAVSLIISELEVPITSSVYLEKLDHQYNILFPLSVTLPDTVELYQRCHNKVLTLFGFHLSYTEVMLLMGRNALEVAQMICSQFKLPFSTEEYRQKVASYYPEVFPFVSLMKGAETLVHHLHKHNIPIAIASGGANESFDLKTTNHKEFVSFFHHVVLASSDPEVKNGKPAPDVFLICAQRFDDKPDPRKVLVFEDAPNGVAAAAAAGMQVVMIPDARLDKKLTEGATQILESLEDFQPHLFGLPAFEG